MSVSTSLPYYVWIEAILHCVGRSSADTPTRRKSTNDKRIYLHRNKLTSQRRPEERAAELLHYHHLLLQRSEGLRPCREICEWISGVETEQRVG